MSGLHDLFASHGQSPWIDNIRRDWLDDGTLATLVDQGVRGVTSNPSIFARALATSDAYSAALRAGGARSDEELFEELAVRDVRDACQVLDPVYSASRAAFAARQTEFTDGFVSLEVDPRLAADVEGTVHAAERLSAAVGTENLLIKIPATDEGLGAIPRVLARGISVNVTLIFSVERYDQVFTAWLEGLERADAAGDELARIASVASVFVSRVDTAVDAQLAPGDPRRGRTANAQVAAVYDRFLQRSAEPRTRQLLAHRAPIQRPLWASTSVKNPDYDELAYVAPLAAPSTVNTMPDATLEAARRRTSWEPSALTDTRARRALIDQLSDLPANVDLAATAARLEAEGVQAFIDAYESVLATVASRRREVA
ncbi:MAG: transaldolase [Acidimicrobiales bacterium]